MKKIIVASFICVLFAAVLISSCKKITYASIGEPISLQQNLIGNWKLDSIEQVDQNAVDKGFPAYVQKQNITGLFGYSTVSASFTSGGDYTFTNPDNAPLFFDAAGKWTLVENGGPLRIKLAGADRTDTLDFAKAYRVSDNKLALRYNRAFYTGAKKVFVYYNFNFSKK